MSSETVANDPPSELPATAIQQLQARMETVVAKTSRARFPRTHFRWPTEAGATTSTSIDWIAQPERIVTCLGRAHALSVLDVEDRRIGDGGRRLQEEYAEWRVVRSERGIERVDFTTETPEYWSLLAAYAPERALEVVAEFAGEPEVDPSLVYGVLNPFDTRVTPALRDSAFAEMMLADGVSPYNNGSRAITCMVHPGNSVAALLELAVAATNALAVSDPTGGSPRCPTCVELATSLGDAAVLGRASDPLVVERMARLAFEGRRVGLDTPGPLAISGIEYGRLRTPAGDLVPRDWFQLSRAMRTGGRYQRLSLAVPDEGGFCVSDLVDVATEERISSGAQIADLVQVSLYLRTTEPTGAAREEFDVTVNADEIECAHVRRIAAHLEDRRRRD